MSAKLPTPRAVPDVSITLWPLVSSLNLALDLMRAPFSSLSRIDAPFRDWPWFAPSPSPHEREPSLGIRVITQKTWSGRRESNPRYLLGKQKFYH